MISSNGDEIILSTFSSTVSNTLTDCNRDDFALVRTANLIGDYTTGISSPNSGSKRQRFVKLISPFDRNMLVDYSP